MSRPLVALTWNVHRCVGWEGVQDVQRVGGVIRETRADVVALQEVETHLHGEPGSQQLEMLARLAGYVAISGPTIVRPETHYGNGILTRWPIRGIRYHDLSVPRREPRGILDVDLDVGGGRLRVVNTHLGLLASERRWQVTRLLEILGSHHGSPLLLLGDFNEWLRWSRSLLRLRGAFGRERSFRTFPAHVPILSLDRVWVQPPGLFDAATVLRAPAARRASDHLPILVRIWMPEPPVTPRGRPPPPAETHAPGPPAAPLEVSPPPGVDAGTLRARRRHAAIRALVLVVLVAGLAAAWRWTPLGERVQVEAILAWMARWRARPEGAALVLGAFILGGLLVIPVNLLIFGTVVGFGPVLGAAYALVGCILNASVLFLAGRWMGRAAVEHFGGERVQRLDRRFAEGGFWAVVLVRFLPVAPYSLVNLASGASRIPYRRYIAGTVLGMLPGIVAWAFLGDRVRALLLRPGPGQVALLAGVVLVVALSIWLFRRWVRHVPGAPGGQEP